MAPGEAYTALSKLAAKWGPWTVLALALMGAFIFRFDQKVDALTEKLATHMQAQERSVQLLRIICVASVSSEGEKEACRAAAGDVR
jgi:hypothetical protein